MKSASSPQPQRKADPPRPGGSLGNRVRGVMTLPLLIVWTFLLAFSPIRSWDIWWHIRTGELILSRGQVPVTDWFTYTCYDQPWIDLHWGFQILVTLLVHAGGLDILVFAKATLLAAAVAIGWHASAAHVPIGYRGLLWAAVAICFSERSLIRPEVVSLVLLAVSLLIVENLDRRPRLIWLFPPLLTLWVNFHGLFVLGLVVLAADVIDRCIRYFRSTLPGGSMVNAGPTPAQLFYASLASLFACLLNPYLEQGMLFPLTLYRKFSVDHDFYATRVTEFYTPWYYLREFGVDSLGQGCFYLIGGVCVASFLPGLISRNISVRRLLLMVCFSFLASKAIRNGNLAVLVMAVIICRNLADAIVARRERAPERTATTSADNGSRRVAMAGRYLALAMPIILVVLSVCRASGTWQRTVRAHPFGRGQDPYQFMHAASAFAGQPGFPQRAFLPWPHAGVYIFHNGPEFRVFMDGRLEVAPRELFEKHDEVLVRMSNADPRWEAFVVQQDELPAVLLDRSLLPQIQGMLRTPGWRLVYADPISVVFLESDVADRLKLPSADPTPLIGAGVNGSLNQLGKPLR